MNHWELTPDHGSYPWVGHREPFGIDSVYDVNTSQTKDLICASNCFGPWRGPLLSLVI